MKTFILISLFLIIFFWILLKLSKRNKKNIAIHGLIGSGKTTITNKLEIEGVNITREPIEKWRNSGILGEFYKNPDRWFYTFQVNALLSRLVENQSELMETSALQDIVFGASHFGMPDEKNNIEAKMYWEFVEYAKITHPSIFPKTVIFLKVSPETAYERIIKRNREEEINDKEWWINYLTILNQFHHKIYRYYKINVIYVDGEGKLEDVYRQIKFAISRNI